MSDYPSHDRGTPSGPTNTVETGDSQSSGSNVHGGPSLTFDGNSKCARLTPLLSWNYGSRLTSDSYWYETYSEETGDREYTRTGNVVEVVESLVSPTEYSANVTGRASGVVPIDGVTIVPVGVPLTGKRLKVYGSGTSEGSTSDFCYEDSESKKLEYHRVNRFIPTELNNAWREFPTQGYTGLLDPATPEIRTSPPILIGPNPLFFIAGADPSLQEDITNLFEGCSVNLQKEYILTQEGYLGENSSFAIMLHIPKHWDLMTGSATQEKGYFRVYWSKFAFQYIDGIGQFCPDTETESDPGKWVWKTITEFHFVENNVLVFEVVGRHIVITNLTKTGDHDTQDKRPSFGYEVETPPEQTGLIVESTQLKIGVRGVNVRFSYIPIVYPTAGSLFITKMQTGYSISGLRIKSMTDTTDIMGGTIQLTSNIEDDSTGTFGFSLKISRGFNPDTSPALYAFELVADPQSYDVSISVPSMSGRVRSASIQLGLESQGGTITLDNWDGSLSSLGGVIPCEIQTGWSSDGGSGVDLTTIFRGFINTSQCTKNPNQSSITFSLVGYDQVLKDAIGVNLPIYDGYDDGEAVADLLDRSGWGGSDDIEGGYQLSVPDPLMPPSFMFPMGRSIMDCIRDIATHAGKWAFVDSLGTFKYIEQRSSYSDGDVGTYKEVPTSPGSYDEWLTITGVKVFNELNNAVLVIGLDSGVSPIVSIRTDPGNAIGNMISDTYLGWLKWVIYQDPKINSIEAADGIAERLFQNNNRGRITITGRVWGHPRFLPWRTLQVELITDNVGIPSGANWRIINAVHNLDAQDGSYYTDLEIEYIDPRYNYTSWWE